MSCVKFARLFLKNFFGGFSCLLIFEIQIQAIDFTGNPKTYFYTTLSMSWMFTLPFKYLPI